MLTSVAITLRNHKIQEAFHCERTTEATAEKSFRLTQPGCLFLLFGMSIYL